MKDGTLSPAGRQRRRVLASGAGLLALGALPDLSRSAQVPGPAGIESLGGNVSILRGGGCNTLVVQAAEGLLLVDGGAAERASALRSQLRTLTGASAVQVLFNTHWHPEQTGANEVLAKDGAKILAHEHTRLWLSTDHYQPSLQRYAKARPMHAWPTQTFRETGRLAFGGEQIEYGYLPLAHTDGDAYLYCRESNVIAVGHVVAGAGDPELDWFAGGWLGGRLDGLDRLLALCDDQSRIVPAQGPVMNRDALKAQRALIQEVYDRAVKLVRKGMSAHDMVEAGILRDLPHRWADPEAFMYAVCKGLWAHHDMLSNDIV
jgi:cyclase